MLELHSQPLAIVDVETTGSSPTRNRVLEIAIIRIEENKIVEKFESLVDPECSIPESITAITGIQAAHIKSAPTFYDISKKVEELLKGAVFVAHNAQFDYAFIKAEFERLEKRFQAKRLCTVALSRKLFPEYKHHDLSTIIDRCGFTCEARHRALGDAEVLVDFLKYCKENKNSKTKKITYEQAVESILERGARPTNVDMSVIEALPETAGVYIFYGEDDEKLYIGKSINIKKRVQSHFSDVLSGKALRLKIEVRDIEAIKTHGELGALLLESMLVKQEQPLYNRLLRHAKKLIAAQEIVDEDGYKSVKLEECTTDNKDSSEITVNSLGIFKSLSQAKKVLRESAEKNNLCQKLLGLENGKGSCFSHQLEKCLGACVGKESALAYNMRFDQAFQARKIKAWPYSGPVLVDEKSKEESHSGTAFIIDNWKLIKSFTYDEYDNRQTFLSEQAFDYDAYKILARHLLKNGVSNAEIDGILRS